MSAFADAAGRKWVVGIDAPLMKRVRELTGVELNKFVARGLDPLWELCGDPVALVDVLYVLCRDQADKLGLTDEQFGRALTGDAVFAARDAFVQAFADFYPSQVRTLIADLAGKATAVTTLAASKAITELATTTPEGLLASILSGSATSSPASPASTPPG